MRSQAYPAYGASVLTGQTHMRRGSDTCMVHMRSHETCHMVEKLASIEAAAT